METLDCGHERTKDAGLGTGAALTADGRKICYKCADRSQMLDIEESEPGDKFHAYVSSDWNHVTSWSGGVLMRVISVGERHPFSRERNYFQAADASGRVWSGVGGDGMWAVLRLTKKTSGLRVDNQPADR